MNATEKAEMQVSEAPDGSAIVEMVTPQEINTEQKLEQIGVQNGFERANANTDADSDDGDDGDVDPEREAIRAARREERHLKKRLTKAKIEESSHVINSLRRENERMAERLAILERKTAGSDLARLDKAIEDSQVRMTYAKMKIKEATEQADGASLAEAQEAWYEARRQAEALEALKRKAVESGPTSNVPQAPDPTLKKHASNWMARNDWYDPNGRDMDSQITTKIDEQLTKEGWDPKTPDYWEELDNRLTKYLPHRYNSSNDDRSSSNRRPRSVVTGSGRESAHGNRNDSNAGFHLSPERVLAIKEAGRWDNLAERKKMIQKYMEYDRMHGTRNN